MGKVLIVAIFVIGAIFTVIILSVQDKAKDTPELLSENEAEMQAKLLCREALNYGMKKIHDAGVSAPTSTFTQTFTNFQVESGIIDSIQYTYNTSDGTITISSFASYQYDNETLQHKSTAIVNWTLNNMNAAITANGNISVGGHASVVGPINQNVNPVLDFEEFFGKTKAEMRAIADFDVVNPHINPDPDPDPHSNVSGVTYVSFTHSGRLKVTQPHWQGSGILVVDGDCTINGGSFSGILWVTGDLFMNGNNGYYGAIYVEGGATYSDVNLLGTSDVYYDAPAIIAAMHNFGTIVSYELEILDIFEDD